jgi:hypothetical protein
VIIVCIASHPSAPQLHPNCTRKGDADDNMKDVSIRGINLTTGLNTLFRVLGTPVYTQFQGPSGSVDEYLIKQGKMSRVVDSVDIPNIKVCRKRPANGEPWKQGRGLVSEVVDKILMYRVAKEEAGLGKPVLVLRDVTERLESVDAGTVRLVGTRRKPIVEWTERLLEDSVGKA